MPQNHKCEQGECLCTIADKFRRNLIRSIESSLSFVFRPFEAAMKGS